MKEAVIVSTARTPIGKAYRGGFNNLQAPTMGAFAISAAVARAGIEGDRVEDCIMGAALTQGTSGMNIGRNASLRAGLPVTVAGMTLIVSARQVSWRLQQPLSKSYTTA